MNAALVVNSLPLPPALCAAISEGRWRRPSDAQLLRVFRERPIAAVMLDLAEIREVNHRWRAETDPAYFGHRDDRTPPGDIDRLSSLIVGTLGPDLPFALDYRSAIDEPAVVYLHSGGDRWITVARSIDDLLRRLGLDRAAPTRRHRHPDTGAPPGARRT